MSDQNLKVIKNDIKEKFKQFFNRIKENWRRGFKLLKNELEKFESISDLNTKKHTYIRDPLWGEITLNMLERVLLDSFFIQRLRNINQMGGTRYVYPSANHKRFDHSLGTFRVISLILDEKLFKRRSQFFLERLSNSYIGLKEYFTNENIKSFNIDYEIDELKENIKNQLKLRMWINTNLKISMLLHDMGHYAFSHAFEVFLIRKKNLITQYRKNWREFPSHPHEQRGKDIISGNDELINELFNNFSTIFKDFFDRMNLDSNLISKSITGESNFCLSELVNGPLDADKMDYLARDFYFTMAPNYLNIFDRIYRLASIEKYRSEYRLVFKQKAISAIIKIILTRTFEFNDVVNHPIQLCFQGMFIACLEKVLQRYPEDFQIEVLKSWELMNDNELLKSISILSQEDPLVENLLYGISNRVFYKEVRRLQKTDFQEFISLMEASNLDSIFIDGSKMKEIFTEDRISGMTESSKKIVKKLISKMDNKYGILIFFNIENKRFVNYLKKILILESDSKNIVSLSDYITNKFEQRSSISTDFVKLNFEQVADILNILEKIDNNLMIYSDIHIKKETNDFFNILKKNPNKLKHFLTQTLKSESEECWQI